MGSGPTTLPPHLRAAYDQGREWERERQQLVRRAVVAEESVRQVLTWFAGRGYARPGRTSGLPLWSVVSDVLALGCTSATELCERHGLDPHQRVRPVG